MDDNSKQDHPGKLRGHFHESSDCFEYLKYPYSNQATQKILAKFSYPKNSRDQTFQTPKSSSIIPDTWNPKYPPPPGLHPGLQETAKVKKIDKEI